MAHIPYRYAQRKRADPEMVLLHSWRMGYNQKVVISSPDPYSFPLFIVLDSTRNVLGSHYAKMVLVHWYDVLKYF